MRILLGFLSGLLGLLAGWAGLATGFIGLSAPDREGGTAMAAVMYIGPFGGLVGFALGVGLFVRVGLVRAPATVVGTPVSGAPAAGSAGRSRVSYTFAAGILVLTAAVAWWGWYEFIRSPYLSHGDMALDIQIMLPPGTTPPADKRDVHMLVAEGGRYTEANFEPAWTGHIGDRPVILAHATFSRKTYSRWVSFSMPGIPAERWPLALASDPDPVPAYTPWRAPDAGGADVAMNYRLGADR